MHVNTFGGRIALGVLAGLFVFGATTLAADGFAKATPVGTWYLSTEVGPGATLPALVTYNIDGTLTYVDAFLFGGVELLPFKVSPFLGVWRPTGNGRFGGTSFGLLFEPTSNVAVAIMRARSALRFDGSRDRVVGKIYVETVMCPTPVSCPDPTDPSVVWTPAGDPVNGFAVVLTRASRVPALPLQ
jgi:hypothetical protein